MKSKTTRLFVVIGVVILVAALGVGMTFMGTTGGDPGAQVASGAFTERGGVVVGPDGALPGDSLDTFADDGTVVLTVYSDYLCPYCAMFEILNAETIDTMLASGEIVLNYHRVAILDRASPTQYPTRAAAAALYVAEHNPAVFKEFNDALFMILATQESPELTDAELGQRAAELGADEATEVAIAAGEAPRERVAAFTEMASQDLGSLTTPTILLNGVPLDPTVHDWRQPGVLENAIREAGDR